MRIKLLIALFLCFVFVGFVSAQTVKTAEARKLDDLEKLIVQKEKEIESEQAFLAELSAKYSPEYFKVMQTKAKITVLQKALAALYDERKLLLTKELVRKLPNNQIELLKIIIEQNERIIYLLEKLQKE